MGQDGVVGAGRVGRRGSVTKAYRRWAPIGALLVVVGGAACASDGGSELTAPRRPSPPQEVRLAPRLEDLVVRLQKGGYVVLLRHAATDTTFDSAVDLADCSTQRNLSLDGRAQALDVGAAIRRFDIPVGEVLASPYCRTRQTARVAFGRVETTMSLLNVPEEGRGDRRRRDLRRLLSRAPGTDNMVLVTHSSNIGLATGHEPSEGEALVVRPRGSKGFRIMGTLSPKDWARLARAS